jgi:hypothetical protein
MSGKFITSKKDVLHPADQYHAIEDEKLRQYFIAYSDILEESARDEIVATYNDPYLAADFRAWRTFNDLKSKGFTKDKTMREVVRIPAGRVYEFLTAVFEPFYGKRWIQNKKALRHELVRPWWLVSKI